MTLYQTGPFCAALCKSSVKVPQHAEQDDMQCLIFAKGYDWRSTGSDCDHATGAVTVSSGEENELSSLAAKYGSGDLCLVGEGAGPEGRCPPAHHLGSRPCSCQGCSVACGCQLLLGKLHIKQCFCTWWQHILKDLSAQASCIIIQDVCNKLLFDRQSLAHIRQLFHGVVP